MKRVFIIGAIGAAVVAILIFGLMAGVVVASPLRAQFGQMVSQALNNAGVTAVQAQASTPGIQLKDEKGILVGGVFQDSPADKAGLVRGDIILDVDGQAVNTESDLRTLLSQHKVGDSLKLTVQHGDSQKSVTVTLAEPPVQAAVTAAPQNTPQSGQPNATPNQPKRSLLSGPYLGIVPLGAGQFGGKGGFNTGVEPIGRIVNVAAGSPAEKAGLKAGETILSVDGTTLDAQNPLTSLISKHKPGDTVKLTVAGTDGTQRDVSVTLGDNPQQQGTAYLGVSTGGFRHGRGFFGFGAPGGPNMPGSPNMPGFPNGVNPRNIPGLQQHPGAYIDQVTANSPAEKAGLKAGQIIEAVDGKKIDGAQVLADAIGGHKPGEPATLSVYDPQSDQTNDVKVTLGDNPQKSGSAWLGIQYGYFNLQNLPAPAQPTPGSSGTQF